MPMFSSSWRQSFRVTALSVAPSVAGVLSVHAAHAANPAPPLMLANVYHPGVALADYWVSEKYDGVRGYWNGTQLMTRRGEPVATPAWFTAGWPAVRMDGELWAGRGQFAKAVSTVRQKTPDDAAWRRLAIHGV